MLKEIKGHKFLDDKDRSRFLHQFFPKDLEQIETSQLVLEVSELKNCLNHLKTESFFKIYSIGQNFYLESEFEDSQLDYFESSACVDGINPFLFADNIFSKPIIKDDYVKINGAFLRFIKISMTEDHQVDLDEFSKFGNFFIVFKKIKTLFSKYIVNDARKMSHSSLYSALSDIEGIETYQENEEMLRKIVTREEELFNTEIQFVISSIDEVDLKYKTDLILDSLEVSGFAPSIVTSSLINSFNNYTPGIRPVLQKSLLFHSSLLANAIPTHRDNLMDCGVCFHSRSGSEIFFDSRNGDSYSICITGKTGNGKTVFANKLIDYELSQGRKILVFEPKGDYRKHALLKDAHIIDQSLNPMIFKDPMYFRNLILSKIPNVERSTLWEGKLLKAIRETKAYESCNFFKGLDTLKKKGFKDLEYYFEDIVDKISESKMELADFTYIDFSTFSDAVIPFLLSFSFEYVKRLNAPYDLIIDEAHRVFERNPTFLEQRVREMRVQNASLIPITQKYSDLVSNYFGEVVADNCFHKFFFSQQIDQSKGIGEFDQFAISSLRTQKGEYSEFYYKSDNHRKVLRYYPTLKELEVFGSEKNQTSKMLRFIKDNLQYFTVDECINQWVGRKYA